MRLNSQLLILMLAVASIGLFAASSQAQITFPDEPKGDRPQQPLGELGWEQVSSPTTKSLHPMSLLPNGVFYVGGGDRFLKSTDFGQTWRLLPTVPVGGYVFFDEFNGVGTSGGPPPNLYLTSDGGTSWDTLTSEASGGEGGRPGRLHFPSRDTGYACGLNAVMRTTNGGKTWYVRDVPYFVYGLHGPDARTMFLVGDAYKHQQHPDSPATAAFFRTSDAGKSWASIDTKLGYQLDAVFAIDPLHIVAVSVGGKAAVSRDGGTTWKDTLLMEPGNGFNAVSFTDKFQGFAVGANGRIFRTTDGGLRWTEQPTPTIKSLKSVAFVTDSTGIAVGDNGTILRTTNAGLAWVQVAPTPLPLINRIVLSESGTTSLRYELPSTEKVTLTIYSLTGAVVAVLKDHLIEHQGWHEVDLSSHLMQGGTYLYTITAGRYTSSGKFTLTR